MMNFINRFVINLDITTWQGISLGAIHYYAELQGGDKKIKLTDKLTTRQATKLNKAHGVRFYKSGDEYEGFDSKEDAIKSAIKQWLNHFPNAKFLVLGCNSYVEPKPLLATTLENEAGLKDKIDAIIEKCETIGWYDNPKNDDLMDQYYEDWLGLLKEVSE